MPIPEEIFPLQPTRTGTDIVPVINQDSIVSNSCDSTSLTSNPVLSVCISLKNRSRIIHDGKELMLFPNCIKSLASAAQSISNYGKIEVVIADFLSDDWPLESWIHDASGVMDIQIVKVEGDFSKGLGLNLAARKARSETLLLCDADMLVDDVFLRRCILETNENTALFPIMRMLNQDGNQGKWQYYGKGNASLRADLFHSVGGVPEFKSWGGEDTIFYDRVSSRVTVRREIQSGLLHQWHPEKSRHENYIRPRKRDNDEFLMKTIHRIFWGAHPEWTGLVHLHKDGVLIRPGVDEGSFEYKEGEYLHLHWERSPSQELVWDSATKAFVCTNTPFTLREMTSNYWQLDQVDRLSKIKISCICVTKNRPAMLRQAIDCFLKQEYPNKELVILIEENDEGLAVIHGENVKHFIIPRNNMTLGELRNYAIEKASGDYIAQWDDDDWSHPKRLIQQFALLNGRTGNLLERITIHDQEKNQTYISHRRLWEGSVLVSKKAIQKYPYPALTRGEDTPVIRSLYSEGYLGLINCPELYVYKYHGENTWDRAHFEKLFNNATKLCD